VGNRNTGYYRREPVEEREVTIDNQNPKVLVADDDVVIRDLFERFLRKQDYRVYTASDGFEALHKIKRDNYDMLILDIKMPRMDGMELLRKIKELKKDLIVIIVTGYATIDTVKESIRQGCFDYIAKPFDIGDISIIIKRAFEARKLAEEKKRLQEHLQTAEKFALLAQMGAGVAHQVKTVLATIKLFLEILKPKLLQAKDDRNTSLILEKIERTEKLVTGFLGFAKPGAPKFIKTDINSVIKKSLQFLRYKFRKQKVEILDELNNDIPEILCDPAGLEGVFLGIFSSSIDAMPGGGDITIKSEISRENVAIIISNAEGEIPSEDIQKLFNPFLTTNQQGLGLGLSFVKKIIDAHKGTIEITRGKNKGTTIRVELPMRV